jgi:hypothetical protein
MSDMGEFIPEHWGLYMNIMYSVSLLGSARISPEERFPWKCFSESYQ